MHESRKGDAKVSVTMLIVGIVVGLMLTGTAAAASYLTVSRANKLYLQNTKVVVSAAVSAAGSADTAQTVACPAGYQALGGGPDFGTLDPPGIRVVASSPTVGGSRTWSLAEGKTGPADGWYVRVVNDGAGSWSFRIAVTCSK